MSKKRTLSMSLAGLDDSEMDFHVDDNEGDSGYELDLTPLQEEVPFPSTSNMKKQCQEKREEFIIAEDVEEFVSYEAATHFLKINRMKYA